MNSTPRSPVQSQAVANNLYLKNNLKVSQSSAVMKHVLLHTNQARLPSTCCMDTVIFTENMSLNHQKWINIQSQLIMHVPCTLLHYSKQLLNDDDINEYLRSNCGMCQQLECITVEMEVYHGARGRMRFYMCFCCF